MRESIATDPPPQHPTEPDAAECCGEGCPRCVFDVYDEAMESYRIAFAAWQSRQTSPASTVGAATPTPAPGVSTS